jgi:hypothetical protein
MKNTNALAVFNCWVRLLENHLSLVGYEKIRKANGNTNLFLWKNDVNSSIWIPGQMEGIPTSTDFKPLIDVAANFTPNPLFIRKYIPVYVWVPSPEEFGMTYDEALLEGLMDVYIVLKDTRSVDAMINKYGIRVCTATLDNKTHKAHDGNKWNELWIYPPTCNEFLIAHFLKNQ